MEASVWLNRYAKYWQGQFDLLAATLAQIDERRAAEAAVPPVRPESDERPPRSAQPNAASTPAPRSPPRSRRAQQRVLQQADQPTDNRRRSKRRK